MAEARKVEGAAMDPAPVQRTPLGTGPWYRYRHLVYTLFAANVAMVFYAVLNQDKFFPRKPSKEEQGSVKESADGEKKKEQILLPASQTKLDQPKPSPAVEPKNTVEAAPAVAAAAAAAATAATIKPQAPHVSHDEQIEIYKWMLEEKRKVKPSNREEKARIDLEKGILKDYIRGKVPSLTS